MRAPSLARLSFGSACSAGARIVALSHCGRHAAAWRTQDVPRAFSNSSRGRGRKGDLDVALRIPSRATRLVFSMPKSYDAPK